MKTVVGVLHELGYRSSEEQLALALRDLLGPARGGRVVDLSSADDRFLVEYSGIRPATAASLADLDTRSAAMATVEAAGGLSRTHVAGLLGVDVTRVSHQMAVGDLYSYKLSRGRSVYPDWQFEGSRALPHLREILAALPEEVHPVTLRTFMTTVHPSLQIDQGAASPRDWLLSGGRGAPVVGLAKTVGEQV